MICYLTVSYTVVKLKPTITTLQRHLPSARTTWRLVTSRRPICSHKSHATETNLLPAQADLFKCSPDIQLCELCDLHWLPVSGRFT